MTNLFTANDAVKLSQLSDPMELVKLILEEIKDRAVDGKWDYTTRSYGFGESGLYTSESDYPQKIKTVLTELRKLGFSAEVVADCAQFVDIYLLVSWR